VKSGMASVVEKPMAKTAAPTAATPFTPPP
jgi:hypothetical protein